MAKNIEINIQDSSGNYEVLYPKTLGSLVDGTVSSATTASSCSGNSATATTLATARTIRTNLASTSTASFNGGSNITPGVTGTLSVSNGGTGVTSLATLANSSNLGGYFAGKTTFGSYYGTGSNTSIVINFTSGAKVLILQCPNGIYTLTSPSAGGTIGALIFFLDTTISSCEFIGLTSYKEGSSVKTNPMYLGYLSCSITVTSTSLTIRGSTLYGTKLATSSQTFLDNSYILNRDETYKYAIMY